MAKAMAANGPGRCCTIGVAFDGTPTGQTTKLPSGIEAYLATPPTDCSTPHSKTALIFLTDVIGIWQNSKLMADQYAANGYHTVIPDIFRGDPAPLNRPPGFDLMTWRKGGSSGQNPHDPSTIDPIVEETIKWLKGQGMEKIGAVGYCFGAKYVVRYMTGKGIDVGFVAHPSFVEEDEIRAIKGPLSIAAAETDEIFPVDNRYKTESLLRETKQDYQINLFSGTSHGFSVRGDLKIKQQKFAKEQAFYQAVAWIDHHLA